MSTRSRVNEGGKADKKSVDMNNASMGVTVSIRMNCHNMEAVATMSQNQSVENFGRQQEQHQDSIKNRGLIWCHQERNTTIVSGGGRSNVRQQIGCEDMSNVREGNTARPAFRFKRLPSAALTKYSYEPSRRKLCARERNHE